MRHLLSLLFILALSTCVRAQISIKLKPGRTDSARWELIRIDGGDTVSINRGAWDTLPDIIDYGQVLFREGGFVGGARVPRFEEYYTDEVLQFMGASGLSMDEDRFMIISNLQSFASPSDNIMVYDTITNRDLVGTWTVISSSCGVSGFSVTVEIASNANGHFLQLTDDLGSGKVQNIGDGVVGYFATGFNREVVIKRTSDGKWEGPGSCDLIRSN